MFTPGVSGKCEGDAPVYVLPSFDKWIPDKMQIEVCVSVCMNAYGTTFTIP